MPLENCWDSLESCSILEECYLEVTSLEEIKDLFDFETLFIEE